MNTVWCAGITPYLKSTDYQRFINLINSPYPQQVCLITDRWCCLATADPCHNQHWYLLLKADCILLIGQLSKECDPVHILLPGCCIQGPEELTSCVDISILALRQCCVAHKLQNEMCMTMFLPELRRDHKFTAQKYHGSTIHQHTVGCCPSVSNQLRIRN